LSNAVEVRWRALLLAALSLWATVVNADDLKREPIWKVELGSRCQTCPAIAKDGTIYVGTREGKLAALSPEGEVRWTCQVGDEIQSSPAIGGDGTIYFGCRDRFIYAVSGEGEERWRFKTGAWVDSSPAIAGDGSVVVGSWDGKLYCLDAEGTVKWAFTTGAPVTSSPAIGLDGTIYFGSHDGKLYALTAGGTLRWSFQTEGQITASPAINGTNCLYVTSVDGFLYALNHDGGLRWKLKTGGITESSPAIGPDGTICVGVNKEHWAISPAGAKKWSAGSEDLIRAAPAVDLNGFSYSVTSYGTLRVYNPEGGLAFWCYLYVYNNASVGLGMDGKVYIPYAWSEVAAIRGEGALARSPWPKFKGNLRNTGNLADGTR